MSILRLSLSIPPPPRTLSSSSFISGSNFLSLTPKLSHLSIYITTTTTTKLPPIRMGGGPRTFPGGVSKWQWKRMQAKKAKQLLKARLARERQVYEMRKRAELKAAVSELERPWEVVQKAPRLFSVAADEQVKVLADRFQKPGGFDMWSEKDGPQLFNPVDGAPSARFFPKGVVHSIKPYGKIDMGLEGGDELLALPGLVSEPENENVIERKRVTSKGQVVGKNLSKSVVDASGKGSNGKLRNRGKNSNKVNGLVSGVGVVGEQRRANPGRGTGKNGVKRGRGSRKLRGTNSEVFDMSLQQDGSYGFQAEKWESDSNT